MKKKIVKYPLINSTGSTEDQITIFSNRIKHINDHLKVNKNDINSRRSLLFLVGKRRKLLKYIKIHNIDIYINIMNKLEFRK